MERRMGILETVVELSREFGTPDYVKGGGGNSSCKNASTLWVKPSGTTLLSVEREAFVAMDRAKLAELYSISAPNDPVAREALVKGLMAAAVLPGSAGRPSVEAPLHDSFDGAFVIHLHPTLVNGMTCARDAEAACRRLFPDALWIPYADPGYTLFMACRRVANASSKSRGRRPAVAFLQNHGVIAAGDTAETIRAAYRTIMNTLREEYKKAGVSAGLVVGAAPHPKETQTVAAVFRQAMGGDAAFVLASGSFPVPVGPVTPDNIVYAKGSHMTGRPTREAVEAFRAQHGYFPRVAVGDSGVFAVGPTEKSARLAIEFSQEGAVIAQLAQAFGGVRCLDKREREFIENWEVEAYRRKVAEE